MNRKIDEWPWNRPWPWVLFIAPFIVFMGLIWIPTGSCAMYTGDVQGDTSCYVGPVAGYGATWAMTTVALILVVGFAAGLVRALIRGRRGYRKAQ